MRLVRTRINGKLTTVKVSDEDAHRYVEEPKPKKRTAKNKARPAPKAAEVQPNPEEG